jgi:hypothetical protein
LPASLSERIRICLASTLRTLSDCPETVDGPCVPSRRALWYPRGNLRHLFAIAASGAAGNKIVRIENQYGRQRKKIVHRPETEAERIPYQDS